MASKIIRKCPVEIPGIPISCRLWLFKPPQP